jgi:hypothetical protein
MVIAGEGRLRRVMSVVNRDRWQEVEANSGSKFDDVIRGDDEVPSTVGGAGFSGCDVLDQDGFATILDEYDARLVYLDRRNDVKHAISRITARRLKDTTGRWNRYDGDARLDAFAVDLADFEERLQAVEAEKAPRRYREARPAPPPLGDAIGSDGGLSIVVAPSQVRWPPPSMPWPMNDDHPLRCREWCGCGNADVNTALPTGVCHEFGNPSRTPTC